MIHDDFLNFDFFNWLQRMKNNSGIQAELLGTMKTATILATLMYSKKEKDFANLYFNYDDFDDKEELWETAKEFLCADILDLPFDENLFVIRKGCEDDGDALIIALKSTAENIEFLNAFMGVFYPSEKLNIEKSAIIYIECSYYEGAFIPCPYVGLIFRDFAQNYNTPLGAIVLGNEKNEIEVCQNNMNVSGYKLLQACLIMNTKYAEKVDHKISEKLNKKREKKGRTPFRDYSEIRIAKHYRDSLEGDGGIYTPKKPHWRRGHIRTLKSGKQIPIQPFIVNFNGKDIPKKGVYLT